MEQGGCLSPGGRGLRKLNCHNPCEESNLSQSKRSQTVDYRPGVFKGSVLVWKLGSSGPFFVLRYNLHISSPYVKPADLNVRVLCLSIFAISR